MAGADQKTDEFARHAAAVARELFGAENPKLSSKDAELRFGEHGRHSVDLKKGTYFDHKDGEGGGVLWLIERETGKAGRDAVEWMRDHGFHIEDREAAPPPASGGASAQGGARNGPRYDRNGNWLPNRVPDHAELTKVFDYTEPDGSTIRYQVARFDWTDETKEKGRDKTFVQRAPDPNRKDRFNYTVKGIEPLPYRLAELLEDIKDGSEIFISPAEKKVDMLRELGVPATCNSGGEGRFPEEIAHWFKGANVTVIEDNDEAGRKYTGKVAAALEGYANRVRYLRIPGLPEHGNVDDWLPAGGTAEQLYALARHAPPAEATPFESRFGAVSWLDFDLAGPSYEYLIKGVLTAGELSLLLGESQSGKSFLAIDIAMAVARGVDWFGRRAMEGGVVYQAGESAIGVRRKRFPAYRKHYQVADQPLPVVLLQQPLDLYSSDDPTDAFIEECKHWARTFHVPLRLIVIDTFNKATPGANENDGKDMGVVLARCDRIRAATGAHVLLVHHLNAGGTKARGHTSLFANVENVILTRKVENAHDKDQRAIREWTISKQKDGEDGQTGRFVLPQVVLGQDRDGDKITSCIVAPPAEFPGAEIPNNSAIQLGGKNQVVLRALYDVLEDETTGNIAPPEFKLPLGARIASRKDHAAKFYAAEKPDDFSEKTDEEKAKIEAAARQALSRARGTLLSKAIIGMDEENIWLTGKPVMGFGPPPGISRRRKREEQEPPPPDNLPFAEDDLEGF
ncbi:AAA family ATPase [Devosia ginsengisoli]|uniref:AAA family ATPase n=1 Tax=Devosia ginsengisoli TaxID=400770 RepID=UPI0026EE7184|nr:AAA family ATPase [Devosia ginsengisoli]MCR6673278.1 AAA family ATPase [Devosia ginsengisoli]